MREIKFRGRRTHDKEWVYGNLVIDNKGYKHIIPFEYFEEDGHHLRYDDGTDKPVFFDQETIEQFTGLHDKNGKEIFEGDILHGREEGDGETTAWTDVYFKIVYDVKIAGFIARENEITDSIWDEQICELNADYEVIGNIHEQSRLIDQKEGE